MGQYSAPQRICAKTIFDGNCVNTHGVGLHHRGTSFTNCGKNLTPFSKDKWVTSACAAASLPSRPGCAEHCSAALQPDSRLPPEARTAGYTSAPSPSFLSAAEKPDQPLHGGKTGRLCPDHKPQFISQYLSDGLQLYDRDQIRLGSGQTVT